MAFFQHLNRSRELRLFQSVVKHSQVSTIESLGRAVQPSHKELPIAINDAAKVRCRADAKSLALLSDTDVSRGSWKKNGALHSVIRVSYQAATFACSRTSLRRW